MIYLSPKLWNFNYHNERHYKKFDKEDNNLMLVKTSTYFEITNNILVDLFETIPSIGIYHLESLPLGLKADILNKDFIKRSNDDYDTDCIGIDIEDYKNNVELIRKIVIKNYIKDMIKNTIGYHDELIWYSYVRFHCPLWNDLNYPRYYSATKINYIYLDDLVPYQFGINNELILQDFAFMRMIDNDKAELFIDSNNFETIIKYINNHKDFDNGITELLFYYPTAFIKLFEYKNGDVIL